LRDENADLHRSTETAAKSLVARLAEIPHEHSGGFRALVSFRRQPQKIREKKKLANGSQPVSASVRVVVDMRRDVC
jgi:DNA-nicking Smr family endonuclease